MLFPSESFNNDIVSIISNGHHSALKKITKITHQKADKRKCSLLIECAVLKDFPVPLITKLP